MQKLFLPPMEFHFNCDPEINLAPEMDAAETISMADQPNEGISTEVMRVDTTDVNMWCQTRERQLTAKAAEREAEKAAKKAKKELKKAEKEARKAEREVIRVEKQARKVEITTKLLCSSWFIYKNGDDFSTEVS